MKNNDTNSLESQLTQAGASPSEARALAGLSVSLRKLQGTEPQLASINRSRSLFRHAPGRRVTTAISSLAVVGTVAIGLAIASIAQTTYPGQLLYPVKRLTENVAVIIQPNYRGVLMMRRAQEVKQLVALHNNPRLINATLQSYKQDVAGFKGGSYADFEYCESTLRQAEKMSSGAERLAIAETIASVKGESE